MSLISNVVIHILAYHLTILGNDQAGFPLAALAAVALYLLCSRSQCRIFLVSRGRRVRLAEFGGLQGMSHTVFQNRNSINGYGTGLVVIACADTDGCTGIVHKLVVRTTPAYRCICSRSYIGWFKGMGPAHGRFQSCLYYCIVHRGRNLAYTAADFLYNLTIVICSSCLIALCLCTLADTVIKRKFFTRLKYNSIDSLSRQLHIGVSLLIRSSIGSKGSDGLVFFSCSCLRKLRLHLINRCGNGCRKVLAA